MSENNNGPVVTELNSVRVRKTFAPLAQIEGYWEALRGTQILPKRSQIDPRGLQGALEYCFVLERVAPGVARLRVAGSHLSDLMGMEVRGMPITAFLTSDSRRDFSDMMEEVFETPACSTVDLVGETGFGRPALKAKMILMPLRSDLGDTSRILGGLVCEGDIGRVPRRFSVESIKLRPLLKTASPSEWAELTKPAPAPAPTSAQNTPKINLTPTPSAPAEFKQVLPGVDYLRLVDS